MDGNYYSSVSVGNGVTYVEGLGKQFVLGVDKYLETVELYVITFLGRIMRNVDLAVSWVEKASLPEEKRQVNDFILFFLLFSCYLSFGGFGCWGWLAFSVMLQNKLYPSLGVLDYNCSFTSILLYFPLKLRSLDTLTLNLEPKKLRFLANYHIYVYL